MSEPKMPIPGACEHGKFGKCESCVSEKINESKDVSYDGVSASLGKGQIIGKGTFEDVETKMKSGAIVSDTGGYVEFLKEFQDKSELTQDEIDELYKTTIRHGVIDHHGIDGFFVSRKNAPRKCATQMVYDYKDAVLETIKKQGITKVEIHYDSDMDAICSAYLIKHLIEHGEFPAIANDLAKIVNLLDYGQFELKKEEYLSSVGGVFEALKSEMQKRASAEIAEKGFSPAILVKFETMRNEMFFAVLNALNKQKTENSDLNLASSANIAFGFLSEDIQKAIQSGQEIFRAEFEQFEDDYKKAEKSETKMESRDGREIAAQVVLASSKTPLSFTNISYQRVSPETIVAVFAGNERKGGDSYDIGIKPDMGKIINLDSLCLALNKAEKKKRDLILAKSVEERTETEQKLVDGWLSQADREMYPGFYEAIKKGEESEDDTIKKDPTVVVAGGSLIAASRTSLLDENDFKDVVRKWIEKNNEN